MEKIGLNVDELEFIFDQLKAKDDIELQSKVYNAYMPLIDLFATKFELETEDVQDIYDEAFSYIYNSILQNIIKAKDFTMYFENVMAKQCFNKQVSNGQNNITKVSLSNRIIAQEASNIVAQNRKNQEIARRSLLMITAILEEISRDPELIEMYGLDKVHISIIRDFHGINENNKSYKLAELAKKYNVTEARAQAMLVVGLKKLRDIEEFDPIRQGRI